MERRELDLRRQGSRFTVEKLEERLAPAQLSAGVLLLSPTAPTPVSAGTLGHPNGIIAILIGL